MLNKHNVLNKTLYTLHKNAEGSEFEPPEQLCNAVMIAVIFAHEVGKLFDVGHSVCHHSGNTGLLQHGTVVFAVTDSGSRFMWDAEDVGQFQKGVAFVNIPGCDLDVFG